MKDYFTFNCKLSSSGNIVTFEGELTVSVLHGTITNNHCVFAFITGDLVPLILVCDLLISPVPLHLNFKGDIAIDSSIYCQALTNIL